MRFPVRRVLLGFTVGAAAGWAASLLRRPHDAPPGSSADEAIHLPQEEFGSGADEVTLPEPEEHPPPRKATAPSVRKPPARKPKATPHAGASEPAAGTEAAEPAKPAKPRAPRKRTDPAEAAAATLREGQAEATERLADAEAEATPPPDAPRPRRRRTAPET